MRYGRAGDDGRMTLAEHIAELRSRLIRAFAAIGVAMAGAFLLYDRVFDVLKRPYCEVPASRRLGGEECTLVVTGVLDAFTVRVKVAAIVGVIVSSPVWLYQLWAFIAPGLHRHERRWALIFATCSGALFAAGSGLAYYSLGRSLSFLLSFAGNDITPLIAVDRYLSFVTVMLLVFGVSFEFPLLVVLLNLAGVVSAAKLASWRRGEIFLVFAFAAVITPSGDPITLSAMAIPMVLLYEAAVLVARLHDRRVARRRAASSYAGLGDDEASPLSAPG